MRKGFKSLIFKYSYSTLSDDNIVKDFLLPVLEQTKNYSRSVGFFTVASLAIVSTGIEKIINNNGRIRLLCSYVLSQEDMKALEKGYLEKSMFIEERLISEFDSKKVSILNLENQEKLIQLIKYDLLDVKIIIKGEDELFHDKVGILEDDYGDKIAFIGSMNDTVNAYQRNYEKIRIFKSWNSTELDFIANEEEEFNIFWNNKNPSLKSYTIPEALKRKIIKIIESNLNSPNDFGTLSEPNEGPPLTEPEPQTEPKIILRDYQVQAINNWRENNYNGFFKMATGTGKTWTAIYSIVEIYKTHQPIVVIIAPYKHLVEQWSYDIQKTFIDFEVLRVTGENKIWRNDLSFLINICNKRPDKKLIVISTISSFKLPDFESIIGLSSREKLLIVDEAHRFETFIDIIKTNYQYRLGLSATPEFYRNHEKTQNLIKYFDRIVFEYNLDEAINNGHLVNYEYKPHLLYINEQEQGQYNYFQKRIAGCFKNSKLICTKDKFMSLIRARRSVLAKAEAKESELESILESIDERQNLIIYCGDGISNFVEDSGAKRYIDLITLKLKGLNYKVHKFTAEEDTKTRMELIEDFEKNNVDALVAIRCLDEGVNIPSIKNALILASSEDPREFIQRRGRILRKNGSKIYSTIHDVIMLPNDISGISILKSEMRRYLEYSSLATNKKKLQENLIKILNDYNLTIEDLAENYTEYENLEENQDE